MKRLFLLIAGISLLASCSNNQVTIQGHIVGYDSQIFTIAKADGFSSDTVNVAEDGTFMFQLQADEPFISRFRIASVPTYKVLLIPGQKYHYEINLSENPAVWEYEGRNRDALDFLGYFDEDFAIGAIPPDGTFKEYSALLDERLAEGIGKSEQLKNRKARKFFQKKMAVNTDYSKMYYAFYLQKEKGSIAADADYNQYIDNFDITDTEDAKTFAPLMIRIKENLFHEDSTRSALDCHLSAVEAVSPNQEMKDSLSLKYVERQILSGHFASAEECETLYSLAGKYQKDADALAGYRRIIDNALSVMKGNPAPDFEIVDRNGKTLRLSDLRGKALYIDFWATWCIPCCMQTPYMEKMARKYRGNNKIEFVSISFDENVDDWTSRLAMEKPFWPNYRTADGGNTISEIYGFRGIPRFMLVDAAGNIVSSDAPRPSESEKLCQLIDETIR